MNCIYIGYEQPVVRFFDIEYLLLNVKNYDDIKNDVQHQFDNDYRLDELCKKWLTEFTSADIIIIELDWFERGDYLGARFANHIRLTKWNEEKLRDLPIVLIRDQPIDIVDRDTLKDDLLIFAGQGALFSTYNDLVTDLFRKWPVVEESVILDDLIRQHKQNYIFKKYIDALKFSEQYEDSHSITNQWGALRLAHNIGYSSDDIKYNWPPKLYFKYLQAKYDFKPYTLPTQITAKVLLIDDNADKGWEKVLKKLFNFNDDNPTLDVQGRPIFRTINEKVKNYESLHSDSRKIIEDQDFDLYLIDLRLNGPDEDITTEAKSLSGGTVLDKIKTQNAGNQVIMFTASNKAWNMRVLLSGKNAADGYYIKESTLNASDKDFGKNNTKEFIEQIEACLKHTFLKMIWLSHSVIEKHFESNISESEEPIFTQIQNQLKIAFELLNQKKSDNLNYAMISYFRIFEILVEYFINPSIPSDKKLIYKTKEDVKFCNFDKDKRKYNLQSHDGVEKHIYFSTSNKVMALVCQKLGFNPLIDKKLLDDIKKLAIKRNGFVHPKNRNSYVNPTKEQLVKWSIVLKEILLKLS